MNQATPPNENNASLFGDNYSLVTHNEIMRYAIQKEGRKSPREDGMRRHFETLGFWCPDQEPSIKHAWEIGIISADSFEKPPRLTHAGQYEWVGKPSDLPPKWLWDSHRSATVLTSAIPPGDRDYIAVSYTWGRWKIGERREEGTPWQLPVYDPACGFSMSKLKSILSTLPNCRYFWVDVLCINQSDEDELREEIAKQGAIFANATASLTYLWTMSSGEELKCALGNLGLLLLRALRFSDPTVPSTELTTYLQTMAKGLREDPYFSSLWTLQESIISPSSVWITNNGQHCKVNSRLVTTAFVATACYTLTETIVMRFVILATIEFDDEETNSQRRAAELVLSAEGRPWRDWAETDSSIFCSLSASRTGILLASAKRVATARRGEAVLAALKIADDGESLGEDCNLAPGGLPIKLVNVVLQAEGRTFFDALHERHDGDEFFANVLPSAADTATPRPAKERFHNLPADGFYIADDAVVHLPPGATMQKFRFFSISRIRISLRCAKEGEHVKETTEFSAKRFIKAKYKLWRKEHVSGKVPKEIRIKFLPLAVGKEKLTKWEKQEFPSSFGLILASDKNRVGEEMWYNCGEYVAYSYKTYELKSAGIKIGTWEPTKLSVDRPGAS